MYPSQSSRAFEPNAPKDRSNSGTYKGVRWAVRPCPPGLKSITGDPILAHTSIASGDRTWKGWVVESDETTDGLDFCFLDVLPCDILRFSSAKQKVRRRMGRRVTQLLSKS